MMLGVTGIQFPARRLQSNGLPLAISQPQEVYDCQHVRRERTGQTRAAFSFRLFVSGPPVSGNGCKPLVTRQTGRLQAVNNLGGFRP